MADILLEVKNLKKYFPVKKNIVGKTIKELHAVDDVSFAIKRGETLGVVGESGCGKTTCGRTLLKLYEPTGGQICYEGKDITNLSERDMLPYRKKMQMIFQDPYSSLDSRMMVGKIIEEGMNAIENLSAGQARERTMELLKTVKLSPDHYSRFAHEFSGGQRQRIGIARALAVNPEFLVCDEPISALDVSIQAQVVNMLEQLQQDMGLTYMFVAHDICMVKHISTRIAVMYLGKMVELGPSAEVYQHAQHPYTQALLSSVPIPYVDHAKSKERIILGGDVPSPIDIPLGCRFAGRCRYAAVKCREISPELHEIAPNHYAACHLYE